MIDCRFDNWTRMVGARTDRRSAVKGIAGGAAALLTLAQVELGLAQSDELVAEVRDCTATGNRCARSRECCSLNCRKKKRRRKGRCKCALPGDNCLRDSGCCSGVCTSNKKCDCGGQGDFCKNDGDCCSRKCRGGNCRCAQQGDRCDVGRACCSGSCSRDGFCS